MDNLRRAILLITAVVFVVIAVLGFMMALNYYDASKAGVGKIDSVGDKYSPDEITTPEPGKKDYFTDNVLFIIGEEKKKSAEIISIINFDTVKKKADMLFVPCDLKYSYSLSNSEKPMSGTLYEAYGKLGAETLADILSGMFEININKYLYMDFEDFKSFVNRSGQSEVQFLMPVSVSGKHSSGKSINIPVGTTAFNGDTAMQLAMFCKTDDGVYDNKLLEYYDGTEACRIAMVSNFMNAFVNQKLVENTKENFLGDFYETVKGKTNITAEEFDFINKSVSGFSKGNVGFYRVGSKRSPEDINSYVYDNYIDHICGKKAEILGDNDSTIYKAGGGTVNKTSSFLEAVFVYEP